MISLRPSFAVAAYNFRQWHRNPRIWITFSFSLVLCFLLSEKAVRFARAYNVSMQVLEPFVWTFGDANSILLSSLLLLLLFADMPFVNAATPLFLSRTTRKVWLTGQVLYIAGSTVIYLLFTLAVTSLLSASQSFIGNMWSETAAMLGYSGASREVALPAFVKTLENTTPYACTATILLLMLLYAMLMAFVALICNLRHGPIAGVTGACAFSAYGFLLNPQTIQALLKLPNRKLYQANVIVGWLSPLNHATYHMHNFGYDLLPRLWQTCALFALLIGLCFILALRTIRTYSFHFRGTEGA